MKRRVPNFYRTSNPIRWTERKEREGDDIHRNIHHPNYFGDAPPWWGIYLLPAAAGGLWTIYSPVLIITLLLHISEVALLGKSLRETKPDYKEYTETTNAFIPLVCV
jgi:steroid 5-alpha reductase family enzyme